MLASILANTSPRGPVIFWIIGPIIAALALAVWLTLTVTAARRSARRGGGSSGRGDGSPQRGAVQGGVIQGGPSQRTLRDPAPTSPDSGRPQDQDPEH
ncbi:hypothetical protein [Actinomadura fibrosa]|uniref:Uncharacterized protein n=1 Tax=Actinomadura fibrosa TaxID=111802 RepID=A0ABW2Y158_9ACTN|nr:hypothetical protein [Actinomadura fibrosa]